MGKMVLFNAPSGSGKTTLVSKILKDMPSVFAFSVSATTRLKRSDEVDGKDYYFIPVDEFKKKIKNGEFAEWEEVYKGQFYGTLVSELERIFKMGKIALFDIDVKGALTLKKKYKQDALSIFVYLPRNILKQRLIDRGSETKSSLIERLEKYEEEVKYKTHTDLIVDNTLLSVALLEAEIAINNFIQ